MKETKDRNDSKLITGLLSLFSAASLAAGGYFIINGQNSEIKEVPSPEQLYTEDSPDDFNGDKIDLSNKSKGNDDNGEYTGITDPMLLSGQLYGWSNTWLPLADTPQGLPQSVEDAWQCDKTDFTNGEVSWEDASRLQGSAVFIPDLCVAVPYMETSKKPIYDAQGNEVKDSDGNTKYQLELPQAPLGTHYENYEKVGSDKGSAIIAQHVNRANGNWAGFALLRFVSKGTPIVVRDIDGNLYHYEVASTSLVNGVDMPNNTEVFRRDGEHRLNLITCSGAVLNGDFSKNFIVTAKLVDKDNIDRKK